MNLVIQLLGCSKLHDIPNLALDVNRHLDNVERGSIFMNTKCKSLLGRWYTKEKKEEKEPKDSNDLLIERDRIISCYAKEITCHEGKKVKTLKRKLFRILAVFTKQYNKWFMTGNKQRWSESMKEVDLKKYRCAVRMITDGSIDDYEDVDLIVPNYSLKCVCKIITGVDILAVHDELFTY